MSTCRRCSANGDGTSRRASRTRRINVARSKESASGGPERLVSLAGDRVVQLGALLLSQLGQQGVALFRRGAEAVVDDPPHDGVPDPRLNEALDVPRPPDRGDLVRQ